MRLLRVASLFPRFLSLSYIDPFESVKTPPRCPITSVLLSEEPTVNWHTQLLTSFSVILFGRAHPPQHHRVPKMCEQKEGDRINGRHNEQRDPFLKADSSILVGGNNVSGRGD